jgi:uncharacterized protein YndB with AHSA1/START domain
MTMSSKFVYVTYIRTTPGKLWAALTESEFSRRYWFGVDLDCTWEKGAPWRMIAADGTVTDMGEILEIEPEKRIVIKWRHAWKPELAAEGFTRCTFDIVPQKDVMQLTVTHEAERDNSKTIAAVSGGWPSVLSNLKTLLETGEPMSRESFSPKASDAQEALRRRA